MFPPPLSQVQLPWWLQHLWGALEGTISSMYFGGVTISYTHLCCWWYKKPVPSITATDLEVNESFLPRYTHCHGFASLCHNLLFPAQCIYLHKLELVWKILIFRGERQDYCYNSGKGGKKRKVPSQIFFLLKSCMQIWKFKSHWF